MTKNAIAIATDYNYKHYLKVILTTLKKVECKVDIFVRLVDFTKEQIEEMKLLYDVNFIIDNPNMSNKKTIFKTKDRVDIEYIYKVKNIKDIKKILYSPRSFYTCHSRFKSIKELLEQGYDNILTLDCDTVVLKNFDEVFNFKEDICTVQNIEMNKDDVFSNEGFLLFKNNIKIIDFIDRINVYLFDDKNYLDWNGDHKALHKFYKDNISIKILEEKYKDKYHKEDSVMWSGDAVNKFKMLEKYNEYS